MNEGSDGSAANTPTPIGKPQQPIEDRIHSFTDDLMKKYFILYSFIFLVGLYYSIL